jgi:hypothetical protein
MKNLNKCEQQNSLLYQLKLELDKVCDEIKNGKYDSLNENRTYTNSDVLFEKLFKLCLNNYCISKYDKLKLEECKNKPINIQNLIDYINFVRYNLEERSIVKNELENLIRKLN